MATETLLALIDGLLEAAVQHNAALCETRQNEAVVKLGLKESVDRRQRVTEVTMQIAEVKRLLRLLPQQLEKFPATVDKEQIYRRVAAPWEARLETLRAAKQHAAEGRA